MVQRRGGEELGPIHPMEGRKEWRFEFCFNLADFHLGRFDLKAIQQAVEQALAAAFSGHCVHALVFPVSQPYSAKFSVVPSGGRNVLDLRSHVSALGERLDALLQAIPR